MSSHREAPEISKDPTADTTDTYVFVSPDRPDTATILCNFIPLQQPDGGPNFYEFDDQVQYDINVSNKGKGEADIIYRFRFITGVRNPDSFLYNTGPITDINDKTWNRPQHYMVTKIKNGKAQVLTERRAVPPVNVGARSTPDYATLSAQAIHQVGQRTFFAGQRADAFHVDLGSIFDLGGLRPLNTFHEIPLTAMDGINAVQGYNVHTIGIQVPLHELTADGKTPTDVMAATSVIGVWSSASRRTARVFDTKTGTYKGHGPWQQVSRLGNPLFNEVLVGIGHKDYWNSQAPSGDKAYAPRVNHPELATLLPVLYPNVFPNLKAYTKSRADLNAILLTGIPAGVVDGFQNYTGPVQADMVRLNLAVPPTAQPNDMGLVAGDAAGFPNGRRPNDDVVTIELQALAGLTIPLVDKTYTVDDAVKLVSDGTSNTNAAVTASFPYLGLPGGGYETNPGTATASNNTATTDAKAPAKAPAKAKAGN